MSITAASAQTLRSMVVLAADTTPPAEVTDPANTLIGWAAWIIAAVCVGRLMLIGARWGLSKAGEDTFTHTTTEITLVIVGAILASSAGAWVSFLQGG